MNNKKSIIALLIVFIIGIVGLTLAYFANSSEVENQFNTKEYANIYTEEFVSPDNWLPGDVTNKTLVVKNTGQVDQAVRISFNESWITHNDGTLSGWIHPDGTKSNHTTGEELANDERVAIINLANASDWTKVGNYYYYNYKLAPNESTNLFIESVTFNSKTKLSDTCTSSTSNGVSTTTCSSSGDDYDDAIYKLTFTVETVQYDKYATAWNTDVSIASMKPMNAQEFALKSNPATVTNYSDGNIHQMYTFNQTATDKTSALIDYRYIGDDPYNYVYFNCDDLNNQSEATCEIWRKMGVFDVERPDPIDNTKTIIERRMKLVKDRAFIDGMHWSDLQSNDWYSSTIQEFLNNEYYNRIDNASTYGLKASAQSMIEDAKFYLGAISSRSEEPRYGTTEEIYGLERGSLLCGSCESDTSKSEWTGKIGLMYPSDVYMVYGKGVDNTCYDNPYNCIDLTNSSKSWIYNSNIKDGSNEVRSIWLLSPHDSKNVAFMSAVTLSSSKFGYLGSSHVVGITSDHSYGIRPVLYLAPDVSLISGTGEKSNPYKLSL